eukprot:GHVR01124515.1.p1 GENE.GHVR01124515.1~~GHVR01124515.1.p1  ORF type:complete len:118 (+),score=7.26 GHVR01124515.1:2983-3336(+)
MSNPFPAILIGLIAGILSTLLNATMKKALNRTGVIDSQGALFTFLIPSFIGGIYSAILQAIGASDPGVGPYIEQGRSSFVQGGMQIAGIFITIGIAVISGLILGLIFKCFNVVSDPS